MIEGTDEPAFYNSYVGGKFYRPVESYKPFTEEHKRKISEAQLGKNLVQGKKKSKYQGKAEFYLDGKRMVVDCLGEWANENGYNRGMNAIARTNMNGFIKINM